MFRSTAVSALVFVGFVVIFGVWLHADPKSNSAILTFFLVGVALVGVDLIRQIYMARENRSLYQHAVSNADRMAELNLELQTAQKDLKSKNEELAEANERLTTLAGSDVTTSLPNQRNMSHQIDSEMERSRRTKRPFSLLFLDLDRFKELNDKYGHLVGDDALREFVRVARHHQHGDSSPLPSQLSYQLGTSHLRHHAVSDQQIDLARMRNGDR